MGISRKVAMVAIGSVLVLAQAPVWAGQNAAASPSAAHPVEASRSEAAPLSAIGSIFTEVATHQAPRNCQPDTLYSQHDVIGDPETCVVNRLDGRVGGTNVGAAPSL